MALGNSSLHDLLQERSVLHCSYGLLLLPKPDHMLNCIGLLEERISRYQSSRRRRRLRPGDSRKRVDGSGGTEQGSRKLRTVESGSICRAGIENSTGTDSS